MTDLQQWLDSEPPAEDIDYFNSHPFIKISKVQMLLDNFNSWSTTAFNFRIFPAGNFTFASGSIQLNVVFDDKKYKSVTGAFTLQISAKDENKDYEGTVLSECIKNAAKKLGKRFGRHLNDSEDYKPIQIRELIKADAITRKKYKLAKETGDNTTIIELEERYTELC